MFLYRDTGDAMRDLLDIKIKQEIITNLKIQ